MQRAAELLKKRGYRVEVRDPTAPAPSVGAERGFLREVGNLVFHISLIGVLVSVAIGGMFGYSGQRMLVEGETFVNTLVGYDSFSPGTNFSEDPLQPYSIQLDKFEVEFDRESSTQFGQPIDFTASVTTKDTPGAEAQQGELKVNHPVRLGGTAVYLVGNGYAPVVTVRDGNGNVAFQGPVIGRPAGRRLHLPDGHQGPRRPAGPARLRGLLPADGRRRGRTGCPSPRPAPPPSRS